jgi:hypothetical protein
MSITAREFWVVVHGMGLGAIFLLAFAGGLAGLWSLRPEWVTVAGTWLMALVAWLTVISGTYWVYPDYRARPPEGTTDLTNYPRAFLLANPNTAAWHRFGMEWKEHIAWLSPILATAVAYVVLRYGPRLANEPRIRSALMTLFTVAFAAAGVAGLFGAFINKVAPIR